MPWFDIEEQIREAMARGEFDNLPGAGKPQDLNAYFDLPEELRLGYTLLKNAGMVPLEVQLLREIAALRANLAATSDEAGRRALQRRLNEKQLELDIRLEHQGRRLARKR